MKSYRPLLLAAVFAVTLAGCGSGGGKSNVPTCGPGFLLIMGMCAIFGADTVGDGTGLDLTHTLGFRDEAGMPVIYARFADAYPPSVGYSWNLEMFSIDGDGCAVTTDIGVENGADTTTVGGNAGASQAILEVEPVGTNGVLIGFSDSFSYHGAKGADFRLQASWTQMMGGAVSVDDLPDSGGGNVQLNFDLMRDEDMTQTLADILFPPLE